MYYLLLSTCGSLIPLWETRSCCISLIDLEFLEQDLSVCEANGSYFWYDNIFFVIVSILKCVWGFFSLINLIMYCKVSFSRKKILYNTWLLFHVVFLFFFFFNFASVYYLRTVILYYEEEKKSYPKTLWSSLLTLNVYAYALTEFEWLYISKRSLSEVGWM